MARRPKEHVLEEKSRRAFSEAMPAQWVVRPMDPDYGYDLQVQPFENGDSTTLFFFVQLKGTGCQKKRGRVTRRLRASTLREYVENPVPVMLAFYDEGADELYFDWAHDWARRSSWHRTSTGSVTVSLDRRLDANSKGSDLLQELRAFYRQAASPREATNVFRVFLDTESAPPDIAGGVEGGLSEWLTGQADLALALTTQLNADATLSISSTGVLKLTWAGKSNEWHPPAPNASLPRLVLRATQLLVLELLLHVGLRSTWRDLSLRLLAGATSEELHGVLWEFALVFPWILADEHHASDAVDLAEALLARGETSMAVQIASGAMDQVNSARLAPRTWKILEEAIRRTDSPVQRAAYHFSFSVLLAAQGQARRAFRALLRAGIDDERRVTPAWWYTLARLLLLGGCRRLALRCAQWLSHENTTSATMALLGDAHLELGHLAEAADAYHACLTNESEANAVNTLRAWLVETLRQEHGASLRRSPRRANQLAVSSDALPLEHRSQLLRQAVAADPLSQNAALKLATALSGANVRTSFLCWLQVLLLGKENVQLWAAVVLDLGDVAVPAGYPGAGDLELAAIRVAVDRYGEQFFKAAEYMVRTTTGSNESIETLRKLADAALRRFPHPPHRGGNPLVDTILLAGTSTSVARTGGGT